MSHAFYVYTAYGFALGLTAIIILWTFIDGRLRQKELRALEASGVRRRSAAAKPAQRPEGDAA